ncbi:TetR/AcrR family transcriptional regulator [Dyella sp.]|uniref:TetR/AcrR family transcriptional regulator n=1 Tax=Dyella sp. TaxID=1869338 RepID=UPI002ED5D780
MNSQQASVGHASTRERLLQAAESLFIEHGYESMSLRQITRRADANLAAVNYHFGSKELLMHEMLTKRLDRLNRERLQLLACCEHEGAPLEATAVLSILFVPALRLSRPPAGDPAFMRLLGRVYSDPSPFIHNYLQQHYRPIYERFFEAFSRALPALPRSELGMRLRFCLQSLSGLLAGESMSQLISALSMGLAIDDATLLARLNALIGPMLTEPLGTPAQVRVVERVVNQADTAAFAVDQAERRAEPRVVGMGKRPVPGSEPWTTQTQGKSF